MTAKKTSFPELYHAHNMLHLDDLSLWTDLANEEGSPILELGCGTGRILLPLAKYGLEVYGLDIDPGMLSFLDHQWRLKISSRTHVFQADMSHFHLAKRFGLILLTCNTLSTLTPGQRKATLACVFRHLRPDGLFAASIPNPNLLNLLPATAESELEDIFPHPLDGEPVQVSSSWRRTHDRFTVYWYYDHLFPDGQVQRLEAQAIHYLTSTQSYLDELKAAGFTSVQTYGDFDRTPYGKDTSYLIFFAGHASARW